MKVAVIYYSKSGITEKIAKKIQKKTGADLFLVEPDKNYGGYLSAVISVAGEKLRGRLAKPKTSVADFSAYDIVLSDSQSGTQQCRSLYRIIFASVI